MPRDPAGRRPIQEKTSMDPRALPDWSGTDEMPGRARQTSAFAAPSWTWSSLSVVKPAASAAREAARPGPSSRSRRGGLVRGSDQPSDRHARSAPGIRARETARDAASPGIKLIGSGPLGAVRNYRIPRSRHPPRRSGGGAAGEVRIHAPRQGIGRGAAGEPAARRWRGRERAHLGCVERAPAASNAAAGRIRRRARQGGAEYRSERTQGA